MGFRSRPLRMGFRRPLFFRSGRFRRRRFFVHIRLGAFGHLLQLFDLFRGQLRQAPDEGDEPPDGFRAVFPAERRHSRKAHPVRDDVEKLAVGQLLSIRLRQVGNLRIEIESNISATKMLKRLACLLVPIQFFFSATAAAGLRAPLVCQCMIRPPVFRLPARSIRNRSYLSFLAHILKIREPVAFVQKRTEAAWRIG